MSRIDRIRLIAPIALASAALSCLAPTAAGASSGLLDPTFGEGGATVTKEANGVVTDLVEDHRGRIVAAGVSDAGFVLARYQPDGALDSSFTGGGHPSPGVVRTELSDGGAYQVGVQPDGKIVVAGSDGPLNDSTGIALARYLANGALDPDFGRRGLVRTRLGHIAGAGLAMALQKDGRILVGGFVGPPQIPGLHPPTPAGLLIRYLPNGSVDRGFARNGQLRIAARNGRRVAITDVRILANGKILAAGYYGGRFLLAKFLANGKPDPTFGGKGRVTTKIGRGICEVCPAIGRLAIAKSGGIVFAGSADGRSALVAYRADGGLNRDFGEAGIVELREMSYFGAARDTVIEHSGRIVVAGGSEFRLKVLRFLPDGTPDRSFAKAGVFSRSFRSYSQACAILQQPNGRLLVGGRADLPPLPEESHLSVSGAQFLLFGLRP